MESTLNASKPRKRFVGKAGRSGTSSGVVAHQIPLDILNDPLINEAIQLLPPNYSFEIQKTIHHVRRNKATLVALQMPEGLQMFACTIVDIIERFTDALTVILGDVTYGACCVDDYTALALGCDMLVHYAHSCLVPIETTRIKTLYVFVEIAIDSVHLARTIRLNLPSNRAEFHEQLISDDVNTQNISPGTKIGPAAPLRIEGPHVNALRPTDTEENRSPNSERTRLSLVSTIQFVAAIQVLKDTLSVTNEDVEEPLLVENVLLDTETSSPKSPGPSSGAYEISIPRSKPLSPGEILGCTAPPLSNVDALVYVGDGRFHLEAIMIANPQVPAFRYDPYSKKLTREWYDHHVMSAMRSKAVQSARKTIVSVNTQTANETPPSWGIILGTLGRQGNFKQLQSISRQLSTAQSAIPIVPILLSELSPAKLALFEDHVSTFVQTSCPRLSIDWGTAFSKPLLNPYESAVALETSRGWEGDGMGGDGAYPMDFYAAGSTAAIARQRGGED